MSTTYTNRKALKLATALYMVSDIMSEKEPLKWHIRENAVGLLASDNAKVARAISETLDVLAIARIARAVSAMNADVLETELRALATQLAEEGNSVVAPTLELEAKFFAVEAALSAPEKGPVARATLSETTVHESTIKDAPKSHLASLTPIEEEQHVVHASVQTPIAPKNEAPRAPFITPKPTIAPTHARPVQTQGVRSLYTPRVRLIDEDVVDRQARTEETRNSRREIILRVVGEKDNCSIKDIATKLPSVSEKTIQRELSAMVEEGVLAKEGDRRWSTYKIATRA